MEHGQSHILGQTIKERLSKMRQMIHIIFLVFCLLIFCKSPSAPQEKTGSQNNGGNDSIPTENILCVEKSAGVQSAFELFNKYSSKNYYVVIKYLVYDSEYCQSLYSPICVYGIMARSVCGIEAKVELSKAYADGWRVTSRTGALLYEFKQIWIKELSECGDWQFTVLK